MGFMWQGNPPEQLLTEQFAIETGFHPGQREIIEQLVQKTRARHSAYWKNFPLILPTQRIQEAVGRFLDQEWLPSNNQ